jgi:protein tyrosine/serine phosphatase
VIKYQLYLLALLLTSCSAPHVPVTNGIPNLRLVDKELNIWRGGQPSADGFEWLHVIDVLYDFKLNLESEGPNWPVNLPVTNSIYWRGKSAGFHVSYFPIDTTEQLIAVPTWKIVEALRALKLRVDTKCGVYVHCEHGEDRTGLLIACFRVQYQGWTKAAAEEEMLRNGFHKLPGLWEFWEHAQFPLTHF